MSAWSVFSFPLANQKKGDWKSAKNTADFLIAFFCSILIVANFGDRSYFPPYSYSIIRFPNFSLPSAGSRRKLFPESKKLRTVLITA